MHLILRLMLAVVKLKNEKLQSQLRHQSISDQSVDDQIFSLLTSSVLSSSNNGHTLRILSMATGTCLRREVLNQESQFTNEDELHRLTHFI